MFSILDNDTERAERFYRGISLVPDDTYTSTVFSMIVSMRMNGITKNYVIEVAITLFNRYTTIVVPTNLSLVSSCCAYIADVVCSPSAAIDPEDWVEQQDLFSLGEMIKTTNDIIISCNGKILAPPLTLLCKDISFVDSSVTAEELAICEQISQCIYLSKHTHEYRTDQLAVAILFSIRIGDGVVATNLVLVPREDYFMYRYSDVVLNIEYVRATISKNLKWIPMSKRGLLEKILSTQGLGSELEAFTSRKNTAKSPVIDQILRDEYDAGEQVGAGNFAKVYKSGNKAVKRQNQEYAIKEIAVMRELNHENVENISGFLFEGTKVYFQMEYRDSSLKDIIKMGQISIGKRRWYAKQILSGLAYIHSNGFIHCDIKPENIMLTDNIVKIIDFGIAECFVSSTIDYRRGNQNIVTWPYRDINLFLDQTDHHYSFEVDVWAAAVTFIEMETGKNPFYEEVLFRDRKLANPIDKDQIREAMIMVAGSDDHLYIGIRDEKFENILRQMLIHNKRLRITAQQAFDSM